MTFGTGSISKGRKRMMEHKGSLLEEMPELAAQWHPARNGDLTPDQVSPSSSKKVWWQLGYDDERTGKHFDFEWQEKIRARAILGYGCPYLSGRQVWSGFNDLATLYPDVAREWHPTKNGDLTPSQVTAKNNQVVWWYLPFDDPCTGKHHDFEWKTRIDSRTARGYSCPYLSGRAIWPGFNDLATRYPDIAREWHPTKNGDLTPDQVMPGAKTRAWWILSYDTPTGEHFDFEWNATVHSRVFLKAGCPYLTGKAVWPGFNDLASAFPEIAREWSESRNAESPTEVHKSSSRKYWWKCDVCGHEWRATVSSRTRLGTHCPVCIKEKRWV